MGIRAIEFYSGIGGLHRALEASNIDATVIRAFDWDQTSCCVYDLNYGGGIVKKLDISMLDTSTILELDASLWLLSPSCQPYTVLNPAAKGAADPRAKSFLHLVENVIPELAAMDRAPQWLLVENVAGFETSTTRRTLLQVLEQCNYNTIEFLLTPLQFGIPNSRLRYYLLAKINPRQFASCSKRGSQVWRSIPGHGRPWVESRDNETGDSTVKPIGLYLDTDLHSTHKNPYAIPDRILEKWGRLFDIVLPSSHRSCCFTRGYTQLVERAGSILQVNENMDTTKTFDEFLSLQKLASSGNNGDESVSPVTKLYPLRLRYFSPSELLRLFHFTPPPTGDSRDRTCDHRESSPSPCTLHTFTWPDGVSEKSKYRLIGNSVNVEVVRILINYLFEGDGL